MADDSATVILNGVILMTEASMTGRTYFVLRSSRCIREAT